MFLATRVTNENVPKNVQDPLKEVIFAILICLTSIFSDVLVLFVVN